MKRVILVHASWCGACQPMKAWWFKQAVEDVEFEMMEAEDEWLADKSVCSLPTVLFMRGNKEVHRATGVIGEHQVLAALDKLGWI